MTNSLCPHGESKPHGQIGKDWCAGPPRSWFFEAFRPQLEEQMNLDTGVFTHLDGAREDIADALGTPKVESSPAYGLWQIGDLRHQRLTDDELRTVQLLHNAVTPSLLEAPRQIEVDQTGTEFAGEVVLAHRIRDNLGNMVPLGWFGWGEIHWYGDTPIYDEVVELLGFDPANPVDSAVTLEE